MVQLQQHGGQTDLPSLVETFLVFHNIWHGWLITAIHCLTGWRNSTATLDFANVTVGWIFRKAHDWPLIHQ